MADYIAQPDTAVDPDAPVTSDLMYALRDNPIAMFEGASGAPRLTNSAIMAPVAGTTFSVGPNVSVTTLSSGGDRTAAPKARPIRSGRVTFRATLSGSGSGRAIVISVGGVNVLSENANGVYTVQATINVGDALLYTVSAATGASSTGVFEMMTGNDAPMYTVS